MDTKSIREQMNNDGSFLAKCLIIVYNNQEADEKSAGTTKHHNGKGFNGRDADFGSSLAQQVSRGRILSEKQVIALRKMLGKYAGQIASGLEKEEENYIAAERAAIIAD